MRLALIPQLIDGLPKDISRILEIGPGLGDLSLYLASRFPKAHELLIDISEQGIDKLKKRIDGNARLSAIAGDFRELHPKTQFNLIAACEVFEHIQDDDAAFKAVHQLLLPGGYFIFSVPAFMHKWSAADLYAGHYRRYERSNILAKFQQHGFEIEKLWCYGFPVTHLLHIAYKIYYGWQVSHKTLSMDEATKRSGTERSLVSHLSRLPVVKLMTPFFLCQNLVKNSDIGDGYLVLARKA